MAKRRGSGAESEEGEQYESPSASKRARVDGTSLNDKSHPKRHEYAPDEGDSDVDVNEEEGDDERRFTEKYQDIIRHAIQEGAKNQGRVAQSAIIQALEMHQFMCHPKLSFTFGPQINFIIGHNGSGKSAVLSAITVALGGKATTTGRGSGLKSFIREGQNASEVTITLKNEGEDAYKPNVYGKSVIITRRFTKEGSSTWKIRSKDGRVISTKREELSAICDHMNIHVDNPMNVLSQDSARQFLSASHPSEKYSFFLKGTQLKQLREEYQVCLENVDKTYAILVAKKAAMPDLQKAAKAAKARYDGAKKAVEQQAKVKDLKNEMAWAHVKAKEEEWTAKLEEATRADRKPLKVKEMVDKTKADFDLANQVVAALENDLHGLGKIDHLMADKTKVQETIKKGRDELRTFKNDEKQMNNEIKAATHSIQQYEAKIAEETQKLQADKKAEREEMERKLSAVREKIGELERELEVTNDGLRSEETRKVDLEGQIRAQEAKAQTAEKTMKDCCVAIDSADQQIQNSLNAYGNDMKNVLKRIADQQWRGEKPIGPLGLYVSLKEKEKHWASVLRAQLGQMMFSFAITDPQDRPLLKKILHESRNNHAQIIVSERDEFDFSSGLSSGNNLTVFDVLDIKDEYVLRILINQNRIERTYLARSRVDGQRTTDAIHGGGVAWSLDGHIVRSYGDGASTTRMNTVSTNDRKRWLFPSENPAEQKRRLQANGREADEEFKAAKSDVKLLVTELSDCRNTTNQITSKARSVTQALREAREHRDALVAEHNEDVPVSISALEEAKLEAEQTKEGVEEQFRIMLDSKAKVDASLKPLLAELEVFKTKINDHERERGEIDEKMMQAVEGRLKAQNSFNHYEKSLNDAEAKCAELRKSANELETEFHAWSAKAEEYCNGKRVDNPRKAADVERLIKSMETALREQEKANGATVEDIEAEMQEAQQRLQMAEKELREMSSLNKMIKSSLVVRLSRWHEFRRHIALRTKMQFQHHLSNRAFYGKILFNHDSETLQLKVQTDDQAGTQQADKDPRSLSGGEKSFSTICLLLSLWEAIGCPIRCLDEFDVFMDAINRRISMKMMIETANTSDSKQYILITPQDMSNVQFGPSVRIHRMGDPERGQSSINF